MSGILLEIDGPVARLLINRPEKRNALTRKDLSDIEAAIDRVDAETSVRVLLITGAGEKVFSAGVDFAELGAGSWSPNPLSLTCDRIGACRAPTICVLNGAVYGGAAEIAFACDFRVGADDATVMIPAAKIGIAFDPNALARAVAVVGAQAARRMFLLCDVMDADALSRIGFLDRRVPRADLAASADALAAALAAKAPLAVEAMKAAIRDIAHGALDPVAARAAVDAVWASGDLADGLAAVVAKRPPVFNRR